MLNSPQKTVSQSGQRLAKRAVLINHWDKASWAGFFRSGIICQKGIANGGCLRIMPALL
jgi:hypothetical protein